MIRLELVHPKLVDAWLVESLPAVCWVDGSQNVLFVLRLSNIGAKVCNYGVKSV